jgi:putative nucleotidyltransferase with HDIG domain
MRETEAFSSRSPCKGAGIVLILRRWLVEPSVAIQDPAQRRKARLLAIFVLCLFILFFSINLSYVIAVPGYHIPVADAAGYGLMGLIYVLSRSRFTTVGVLILLLMFPLNVFSNVLEGTSLNLAATVAFLLPSYVLASIFLGPLGTAVFGYGTNLVLLVLPLLAPAQVPGLSTVLGPLGAGVIVVSLCIISMLNRDQIERDRQVGLKRAYNSTLEGWARALEIRDKETEGHSRRVTELSIKLARACGVSGDDLESFYRGALLHDIGKMTLPDSILTKHTELSQDEWHLMRTHPRVAQDLLSSISFLKPSLEIPAYHHEWWNGAGYPNGLKGEQIPLAARIFAVADVWDALLSDRPYRQAWSKEQVTAYIQQKSGVQFDPAIVERFFAMRPCVVISRDQELQ